MLDKPLTRPQAIAILMMFIFGNTSLVGASTNVGQDEWITLLLGAIFAVPVLWINARIISLNPGKGLFDAVERQLGKAIGKVVTALMSWYALHLCALVLNNFTNFIQVTSLLETPRLPVLLLMALVVYVLARSGAKALGKWAVATLPIAMGIVAATVLLSLNIFKPDNFLPVLEHPVSDIIRGGFSSFSFPFAETVLFLGIADFIRPSDSPRNIYLGGLLFSALVLLIAMARNLMVLGPEIMVVEYYPSYSAARVINLGEFLSRIEGSISVNFWLNGITKIALCLITASRGIASLFGIKDWRKLVAPTALLAVMLAQTMFGSVLESLSFSKYYSYYAIPFEIVLPIIIWAVSEIRARKSRKELGGITRKM